MGPALENEALAAAIMNFFRTEFGIDEVIEVCPDGGFQIETGAGASFTFEICRATKAAVARAYLEHIRHVWRCALNKRRCIWFHRATHQEREKLRSQLDRLDAWTRQNLPA